MPQQVPRAWAKQVTQLNIFESQVAEIQINYSHNIPVAERRKVASSKDVFDLLHPLWPEIEYVENFYVLLLNRGNQVLGVKHLSKGGISGTVIDVRVILQSALLAHSSSIILCQYAEQILMFSNLL